MPVGAAGVEEGADRLLRKPEVAVGAEGDDRPGGDVRGVEGEQDLVPLPGVDGQQEVAVRFVAACGQFGAEGGADLGVEFPGVEAVGGVEAGHAAVGGEAVADGDPRQPGRAPRFGGPAGGVGGGEADAPLVEDEPGVAGLVAFEFRVGEVGEQGGGEGRVVEAGVGGEGGGEFAEEMAEGGAVEPEQAAGPDQEIEGSVMGRPSWVIESAAMYQLP